MVEAGGRRRVTATVFAAVAIGLSALFASFTVAPLIAQDITGSKSLAGLPGAFAVAGTASAAGALSRLMAARGRRVGLITGYAGAMTGALVALVATELESFPLLLIGFFAIGAGNSSSLLARYAVADVWPPERSASVVGLVLWAGTIGAAVGPSLVDPSGTLVEGWGLPRLGGALGVGVLGMALAGLLCATLESGGTKTALPASSEKPARRARLWSEPRVRVALAAMVAGQFVMVLIMTMTPVHVRDAGHELSHVGTIMTAHIFGMYALTPLVGRLADRLGALPVIFSGLGMLVVAGAAGALAPETSVIAIGVALFLLGVGWSLGFVAASGLLAQGTDYAERARIQGSADSLVFAAATFASLSSGVLLDFASFPVLCVLGAAVVAVPAAVIVRDRRAVLHAVA